MKDLKNALECAGKTGIKVLNGEAEGKQYMDRVTDLRHVIDEVYGLKAMPFCGTGEC